MSFCFRALRILIISFILVPIEVYSDEARIYGGRYALEKEFPWMVFIKLTEQLNCSGFLISIYHVITAAHCMEGRTVANLTGTVGSIDRYGGQTVTFQSSKMHPDYTNTTYYADVAVLKLSSPIELTPYIDTICFSSLEEYPSRMSVLQMGWGRYSNETTEVTRYLKVTEEGVLITIDECKDIFSVFNVTFPEGILCVKNLGEDGVCEGDSGGPLVDASTGALLGLDSVGFYANCTVINTYVEIFTDVKYHLDWIMEQFDENICLVI